MPDSPSTASSASGSSRPEALLDLARAAKGFMPDDEGLALRDAATRAGAANAAGATLMEIGAWCGKSTVYLGAAAEATGAVLFSIDHHHGSEENQPGWDHHDDAVVDAPSGRIDTLPFWRRTVDGAGLGGSVVGMVGDSPTIAAHWRTPLDFCFTSFPTRPTGAGPPTSCGRRRWRRGNSSKTANAARCGCSDASRRRPGCGEVESLRQRLAPEQTGGR
jgi:hypothetical protein